MIGEMGFGTIDLMISTVSNAAQQIPEFSIFTMPCLFNGMDDALAKIGPGSKVHAHFEKVYEEHAVGMRFLALGASGTRNMSTAFVAVTSPAYLDG
ncbi:MAG: hypothetical protein QNJ43_22110 [Breoghania sp.]|nr:hypothetical protein [Breoghania sp.]